MKKMAVKFSRYGSVIEPWRSPGVARARAKTARGAVARSVVLTKEQRRLIDGALKDGSEASKIDAASIRDSLVERYGDTTGHYAVDFHGDVATTPSGGPYEEHVDVSKERSFRIVHADGVVSTYIIREDDTRAHTSCRGRSFNHVSRPDDNRERARLVPDVDLVRGHLDHKRARPFLPLTKEQEAILTEKVKTLGYGEGCQRLYKRLQMELGDRVHYAMYSAGGDVPGEIALTPKGEPYEGEDGIDVEVRVGVDPSTGLPTYSWGRRDTAQGKSMPHVRLNTPVDEARPSYTIPVDDARADARFRGKTFTYEVRRRVVTVKGRSNTPFLEWRKLAPVMNAVSEFLRRDFMTQTNRPARSSPSAGHSRRNDPPASLKPILPLRMKPLDIVFIDAMRLPVVYHYKTDNAEIAVNESKVDGRLLKAGARTKPKRHQKDDPSVSVYRWLFVMVDCLTKCIWLAPLHLGNELSETKRKEVYDDEGGPVESDAELRPLSSQVVSVFKKYVKHMNNLVILHRTRDDPGYRHEFMHPRLIVRDNASEYYSVWGEYIKNSKKKHPGFYNESKTVMSKSSHNALAERSVATVRKYFHSLNYSYHQLIEREKREDDLGLVDRVWHTKLQGVELDYTWMLDVHEVIRRYNSAVQTTINCRPIDAILERNGITYQTLYERIFARAYHPMTGVYRNFLESQGQRLPGFTTSILPLEVGQYVRLREYKSGAMKQSFHTMTDQELRKAGNKASSDNWSVSIHKITKIRRLSGYRLTMPQWTALKEGNGGVTPESVRKYRVLSGAMTYFVRNIDPGGKTQIKGALDRTQLLAIPAETRMKGETVADIDQRFNDPVVRARDAQLLREGDERADAEERQRVEARRVERERVVAAKAREREKQGSRPIVRQTHRFRVGDVLDVDRGVFPSEERGVGRYARILKHLKKKGGVRGDDVKNARGVVIELLKGKKKSSYLDDKHNAGSYVILFDVSQHGSVRLKEYVVVKWSRELVDGNYSEENKISRVAGVDGEKSGLIPAVTDKALIRAVSAYHQTEKSSGEDDGDDAAGDVSQARARARALPSRSPSSAARGRGASRANPTTVKIWEKLKPRPETKIEFEQSNPKRPDTLSFERYEVYKTSKTIGEYAEKNPGKCRADFENDHAKGFITIL
jgi:hypothetical protein